MADPVSPNMNLALPTPGVSTDYAPEFTDNMTAIDAHKHTGTGDGVQLGTASISVDADFSLNQKNLTNARAVRLQNQVGTLGSSGDVNMFYAVGGNAYFNNGSGVAVQITSGSGVNVSTANTVLATHDVASNYTIVSSDPYVLIAVDTSAARIITLPTAASVGEGRQYICLDKTGGANTHNITINKSGSDTINGQTSKTVDSNRAAVLLVSNGSNGWFAVDIFEKSSIVLPSLTVSGALAAGSVGTNLLASTGSDIEIDASGNPVFITSGGASTVSVGDTASTSQLNLNAIDAVSMVLNGSTLLNVDGDAQLIETSVPIQFPTGATATITQALKNTNSGTGGTLTIQAQNETGSSSTGGTLALKGGSGTSTQGGVSITCGTQAIGQFQSLGAGDARFTADASASFILFAANQSGQQVLFQAIGSGGAITYETATVNFIDSGAANTAMTFSLNGTGTTQIQAAAGVTAFNINQADTSAVSTGASLTLHAQNSTHATSTGGNIVLKGGTGTSTMGNASLIGNTIFLEAASIQITDLAGPSTCWTFTNNSTGTTSISAASTVTALTINQADKSTNSGTAANLTIQAQNETGSSSTGGDLILKSGTGTTQDGFIQLKQGSAAAIKIGVQNLASEGSKTYIDFGATSGGIAASSQLISGSYGVGGNVYFFTNAGVCHFGQTANLDTLTIDTGIHFNVSSVKFQNAVTSPIIAQDDLSTNSGTGATLTIQAQNETGSSSTGGSLILASGTGTTNPGIISFKAGSNDVLDISNNLLQFNSQNTTAIFNIGQVAGTGVTASATLNITGQAGRAVASGTNNNGGNISISGGNVGTGGSGGSNGTVSLAGSTITLTGGGATGFKSDSTGIGFYSHATVAQPSRAAGAPITDSSAGTAGSTIAALTGTYATDVATLRNWGATIVRTLNAVELMLHNNGISA